MRLDLILGSTRLRFKTQIHSSNSAMLALTIARTPSLSQSISLSLSLFLTLTPVPITSFAITLAFICATMPLARPCGVMKSAATAIELVELLQKVMSQTPRCVKDWAVGTGG